MCQPLFQLMNAPMLTEQTTESESVTAKPMRWVSCIIPTTCRTLRLVEPKLFRAQGGSYRRLEELKLFLVVVKIEVRYRRPARYDDLLQLKPPSPAPPPPNLEHSYQLFRGSELLAEASPSLPA